MRRSRSSKDVRSAPPPAFEPLESRLALYQGPMISGMPPISALENQYDTVVRIDTTVGKIDIELFDSVTGLATTIQNYKKYVNSGRFDETFFHRSAGGVLQGGRYKFNDGVGMTTVMADPAIPNGFSRSNLAQTLAMVPDSGSTTTSQFIINLQDNLSLNTASGGYTVFGKVIQGWNIVQAIALLNLQDLDQQLTGSNPNPGTFDTVPVTSTYNSGVGP